MNKQYWLKQMQLANEKYGTNFQSIEDVNTFQKANGLLVDGKIGQETQKKNSGNEF